MMSDEITQQVAQLHTGDDQADEQIKEKQYKIELFVKAGSDRQCIGCCPFSQRLFMILWLKGVVFNVTTVDKDTKTHQLTELAPGTNPPFLEFNKEVLTDIPKCEEYIEAELYPPRFPKLAPKYPQSVTIGDNIFAKFSAFIKYKGDRRSDQAKKLENKLLETLKVLDKYLQEPLDHEIDADDDEEIKESKRPFIDGDHMTLADCNLLPKLNIIRVAGKHFANFVIPESFTGIHRYLNAADQAEEFSQTCPDDAEICWTYGGRKPPLKK